MTKSRKHLSHWTVAVTKQREEMRAAANLERQGFDYYLPRYYELRRGSFRPTLMFEGYVMVKLREGWQSLSSTRGISRVLMIDSVPQVLRTSFVERLRSMEDASGIISLSPRLVGGDKVKFKTGPYADIEGIVQGSPIGHRVQVLFSMLGRSVAGSFDSRALELA